MAVLITGGHGQIGSWTAHYLAQAGEEVILFDINPAPLDYLEDVSAKITSVQGDIMDVHRLGDLVASYQGKITSIVHTVGIMGPNVPENPYKNVTINVAGTINALEVARKYGVPRVVYTSTGAVYKPASGIVDEEAALEPSDLYGATKLASEFIGKQYASTFGFKFLIGRVYFVYGPGKLPSNFIRLYQIAFGALEGMTGLEMERGSTQCLDFTYVKDAARGIALLTQAELPNHCVYNIATGKAISVGEVAELAKRHSHFPVEVLIGPGNLLNRVEALDIARAETDLGYTSRFSLEQGIQEYAAWIKQAKQG